MRMTQRITAFMLALFMLMTILPTAVFAEADVIAAEPIVEDIPVFEEEAPVPEPAPEMTEAPAVTEVPVTEAPATEVPVTEAPATEAPATEVPATEAPATEAPATDVPKADEAVFMAGLATLASGAKVYESRHLRGEWQMTDARGVVYAADMSDDESAVRIVLNAGEKLLDGWVKASQVKMLSEEDAAEYDAQDFDGKETRSHQGHQLLVIPVHAEETAPTDLPGLEDTFAGNLPAVPRPTPVLIQPTTVVLNTPVPVTTPEPTSEPSDEPTAEPSDAPTAEPSDEPTAEPSDEPTTEPSDEPTAEPAEKPTVAPSDEPTAVPSDEPTAAPSDEPTIEPSEEPTAEPSDEPTAEPDDDFIFTEEEDEPIFPEVTEEPLPDDLVIPEEDLPDVENVSKARTLEAPSGLSATHTWQGVMTLTWNSTSDADAYLLMYKAANQTEYGVLTITDRTSYSTDALDRTLVYYFRVFAVELDKAGEIINQSAPSGTYAYIVLGDAVIDDPRGKDSSTIRLTWKAVPGANRYDVMMSVHGADDWKIVRTDLKGALCDIRDLSFNETYDFRVIPKRLFSNGTVVSGNPSYVLMVGSPMETPSFTNYEWKENGLQLTWDAIPGATGYVIYRRSFDDVPTAYQKLVVLTEPVTSYIDTTMDPSTVYYYFVYSFRNCEPEGWRCFSLKGEIGMGVWMPAVTNLQGLSLLTGGTRLSWDAEPGANYYDVYISTSANQTPKPTGRVSKPAGSHSNSVLGKTYYYRVRPVRVFSNGDVSTGPWCTEIAFARQTATPVYRALLIGNTYPGEKKELPGCDNDVNGMATMLGRMSGTPYTITKKFNLTDDGIVRAIDAAFAGATPNDVSLFYYSGHGSNAPDNPNYHGSIVGVQGTYLSLNRLRDALDKVPGRKVVIMDSCHSGNLIGKGSGEITMVPRSVLNDFNSQVISAFYCAPETYTRTVAFEAPIDEYAEPILTEITPEMIAREEEAQKNLAVSGYYVITAAHSTEQSVSSGFDPDQDGDIDKYLGLFTYGLSYGSGWDMGRNRAIATLYADTNGNGEITLYEAYRYAKAAAQKQNPDQTAQIYPDNSGLVIWGK